ncbi:hypothetical protein CPB86DRAFT_873261 [Serendipita vermifera]|nr:hypothetical protein CPB86DRAFT_873261 [Serendipita vermifera]
MFSTRHSAIAPSPDTVRIKVCSGCSVGELNNKTVIEASNKLKTASDLRQVLNKNGIMRLSDAFLMPTDDYIVSRPLEATLEWEKLKSHDESANIRILIRAHSKAQDSPLPDLPTSSEFWESKIAEPISNAADLDFEEWMYLIRANNLFHGVRLGTGTADEDNGPEHSPHLLIKPPRSVLWLLADSAGVETTTLSSKRNTSYVREGWVKDVVAFTTPLSSASLDAKHQENQERTSEQRRVFVTGMYRYQRAIIEFDPDSIQLSEPFMKGLNNALALSSDKEKIDGLHSLFKKFGHVFPLRMALGASLVTTETTIIKDDHETKKTEDDVTLSLNAAIWGWGVNASKVIHEKVDNALDNKYKWTSNTFSVKGGDSTQLTTVKKWIPTVTPFKNWRVIRTEKVIDIRDLIPEPQRTQVRRLDPRPKPLKGCWVDVTAIFKEALVLRGLNIPSTNGYKKILIVSGERAWRTLSHAGHSNRLVIPLFSSKYLTYIIVPSHGTTYYAGTPTPNDPVEYVSLGSFFVSYRTTGYEPDLGTESYKWKQLVAVRRDLCTEATYADTPGGKLLSPEDNIYKTFWKILPKECNGVPLELFGASPNDGKPTRTPRTLKECAIEWVSVD